MIAVAEVRPSTPDLKEEVGYPACSCFDCAHPNPQNEARRIAHKLAHANFAEWLAEHRPSDFKAPYRDMLRWAMEEGTAPERRNPYGVCDLDGDCRGKPAHPEHA